MEYLKMNQLKPGYLYEIDARNAGYGIWIPRKGSFIISRIKFGLNFLCEEDHWDSENNGTAKPIKEIEKSPFSDNDINITKLESDDNAYAEYQDEKKILEYLNRFKE